jgi:hypothetical protein
LCILCLAVDVIAYEYACSFVCHMKSSYDTFRASSVQFSRCSPR